MSRYLVFGVVAIALLVAAMSQVTPAVAFPQITADFNTSIVLAGWVLNAPTLVAVIAGPIGGKLTDSFGRKRVFLFSVGVYTVGSVLSALSPNIYLLILFTLVQGIGAACLFATAYSIIADTFPESRQRSIGLITSIITTGQVIGTNAGGWLIATFGWRSIFWICVPWGIAIAAGTLLLLKPDRKTTKDKIDWKGAALMAGGLGSAMVGFTTLNGLDLAASLPVAAILVGAGIGLMISFVRHETRTVKPLIELDLLRKKAFAAANTFNFLWGITWGVMSLIPLYAVTLYGMSTIESGLVVTPRSVTALIGSVVASLLLVRWGYRRPIILGVALFAPALFLIGLEMPSVSAAGFTLGGGAILLIVMALAGIGQGFVIPAANNACFELMPHRIATISGLRIAFRCSGNLVGLAFATLVLSSAGSFAAGFSYIFFGAVVVALAATPMVFALPGAAREGEATGRRLARSVD